MSDTAFIIQARTGSARMSEKVIIPFWQNKSILELLIHKLVHNFDLPVIVATTVRSRDEVIAEIAVNAGVQIFRGSEDDVLKRFTDAAQFYRIENIIRVCADNPFLSVKYLHQLADAWDGKLDYLSFRTIDGTPSIQTHYGFWAEMVSLKTLIKLEDLNVEQKYREHVTNYIYTHPQQFNIHYEIIPEWITKSKNVRLTLDTMQDFEIQQEIYTKLNKKYENFDVEEIMKFLDENPLYCDLMKNNIYQNIKK